MLVGAAVPHHADGPHREQDGEGLPDVVVQPRGLDLFQVDGVGEAQDAQPLGGHGADDADGEARTREGMAADQRIVEAQGAADAAHLVLEEFAQRLDELEGHVVREAADVVVGLDGRRRAAHRERLDHVRVERPLHEEAGVGAQLAGGVLEDADKGLADDPALPLGVGDALEGREELRPGFDHLQADPHVLAEGALHVQALVHPHEAGVHEDAGELVAHGPVHQRRGHRGIHPAGEAAEDLLCPHGAPDALHGFGHEGAGRPVGGTAANAEEEVLDDLLAPRRVRHLGVELDAVERLVARPEGSHGKVLGGRDGDEAGRRLVDVVAVGAPDGDLLAGIEAVEEAAVRLLASDAQPRTAVFAPARDHPAAAVLREELHPVADTEDGDAQGEEAGIEAGIEAGRAVAVHRQRPAREDHAAGRPLPQPGRGARGGVDLAVHPGLPDAARDELRELGAVVDDEDAAAGGVSHGVGRG